jgi:hypothetical protein
MNAFDRLDNSLASNSRVYFAQVSAGAAYPTNQRGVVSRYHAPTARREIRRAGGVVRSLSVGTLEQGAGTTILISASPRVIGFR